MWIKFKRWALYKMLAKAPESWLWTHKQSVDGYWYSTETKLSKWLWQCVFDTSDKS